MEIEVTHAKVDEMKMIFRHFGTPKQIEERLWTMILAAFSSPIADSWHGSDRWQVLCTQRLIYAHLLVTSKLIEKMEATLKENDRKSLSK